MILFPYMADALLGEGGTARVYRVHHQDGTGPFALKVLTHQDRDVARRLRREARVLRRLVSPHLVELHDLIEIDGRPALVLGYVAGPSLRQALRGGPPPLSLSDTLAREVLQAMSMAHQAGVVHRDLKPGNVLLEPTGTGFRARVADFGLARAAVPLDDVQTASNLMLGTTRYMAPEQLRGLAREVDARTDVWALGALLYELLTGSPAFDAEDPVALMTRITEAAYPDLPDALPGAWRDAVGAALQVDPAHRPRDAQALLERWSRGSAPQGDASAWCQQARSRFAPTPLEDGVTPHYLPHRKDSFVGRLEEGETVTEALRSGQLVTLLGTGGVGKTRLSLEVGGALLADFPGGVWFCDLRDARSAPAVAQVVARVLRVPLGFDPVGQIADTLASRPPMLLILDNFEQIVEHAAATVERWRDAAAQARFLVTSRVPLDIAGEHTVRLGVLALPEDDEPDRSEAFTLFVARARRASSDFEVDDDNRSAIVRLVRGLDGLPLAIEIAAARVRGRSLDKLESRLGRRLHALPVPTGSASGHQRTLRATLDWSWSLLAPHERSALAQLSAFEGGASVEAAESVLELRAGSVQEAVDGLVRASLVRRDETGRLDLLVSVQAYAADQARSLGVQRGAHERHGAFFARLGTNESTSRLDGPDAASHGAHMYRELDNLVLGCRRAVERGDAPVAALCQLGSWAVLMDKGPFGLGHELSLLVRAMPLDEVPPIDRMRVWWVAGITSHYAGEMTEARACYERADHICRHEDLSYMRPTVLNSMSLEAVAVGDLERGRDYLEQAIALRRASGKPESGSLNGNLAQLLLQLGEVARAETLCEAAILLAREAGDGHSLGTRLGLRATLRRLRGDLDGAWTANEASRSAYLEVGNQVQLTSVLAEQGRLHMERGELDEAEERLTAAESQAVGLGKLLTASEARRCRAEIALLRADATLAREHAEAAQRYAVDGEEAAAAAQARALVARAWLAMDRTDAAKEALDAAMEVLASVERVALVEARCTEGELLARTGELDGAEQILREVEHRLDAWEVGPGAWLRRRHAEARAAWTDRRA